MPSQLLLPLAALAQSSISFPSHFPFSGSRSNARPCFQGRITAIANRVQKSSSNRVTGFSRTVELPLMRRLFDQAIYVRSGQPSQGLGGRALVRAPAHPDGPHGHRSAGARPACTAAGSSQHAALLMQRSAR